MFDIDGRPRDPSMHVLRIDSGESESFLDNLPRRTRATGARSSRDEPPLSYVHPEPVRTIRRELAKMSTRDWLLESIYMHTRDWSLDGMHGREKRHIAHRRKALLAQVAAFWHECTYRFNDLVDLSRPPEGYEIADSPEALLRMASEHMLVSFIAHIEGGCEQCVTLKPLLAGIRAVVSSGVNVLPDSEDFFEDAADDTTFCLWDIRGRDDLRSAFLDCEWEGTRDLRLWDTRGVSDMSEAFERCEGHVSGLEYWDVSNVVDMGRMFLGSAFNGAIGDWDTSSVQDMGEMFEGARLFNQPLDFDASRVVNMSRMFARAVNMNSSIRLRNTSRVVNMTNMFRGARAFNQPLDFDTSSVESMERMFQGAVRFNAPIRFSDTSRVVNMIYMFEDAREFNQPLDFDTSSVESMDSMFYGALRFNSTVRFSDTSRVKIMRSMFERAESFNQPLRFDTTSVTNMDRMFERASSFNSPVAFSDTPLSRAIVEKYGLVTFRRAKRAYEADEMS